jgi:orotidine-5'-phosphate decarboxylase
VAGLGADAYTVSPYMGLDTLGALRAPGAGMFVLVRTSNPGAADVEDLVTESGERVWERVARLVDGLGEPGPESGLHDVGAVVGATVPAHVARMRELMPRTPFLLPGIGAQGGRVQDLGPAFAPGRASGLVSASRSIVEAHEQHGGEPGEAARREAERLRAIAWSLG